VDGDCPAAKHCDRNALTCVDDKANGVAIPNDGLHTGVCNDANATATCQSGKCNAVTNTCAGPNTVTPCATSAGSTAPECITNVCGSNGKCGLADGQDGCTTAEPTRCQSNVCTSSGVCLPAGKCWVDSDCPATDYCARNENTCRPKEKSGTPIPNDGLHDGGCTDANAQATCASGKCNAETKTCGEVNESTCAQATQCTSNVCFSDGACGVPSEQACASDAQCRSGACVSGYCANPGAEVRGNGGLRCAVTTTSAASDDTSPAWLFGLALTLAVSRRRKASRTSTTNAQR
jgi:MYXO-CTERM domain-containing protein